MSAGSGHEPPGAPADGKSASGGRIRVLVIQSEIAPAEVVLYAFPPGRFEPSFAGDAITVMAAASAGEVDVVVLDTPLIDLEVDTLLWRMEAESLRVPVVVLGGTPPPMPMRLRFPVQYLPKPVEARALAGAVEALVTQVRARASAEAAARAIVREAQDFLEWSQLTGELTGKLPGDEATPAVFPEPPEPLPMPPPEPLPELPPELAAPRPSAPPPRSEPPPVPSVAAAPSNGIPAQAAVEEPPAVPSAAAPPPIEIPADAAVEEPPLAVIATGRPKGPVRPPVVPRPQRDSAPPSRAVSVEQVLSGSAKGDVGPPGLAGRSVVLAGRTTELLVRLAMLLREAGMDARIIEGSLPDVIRDVRAGPPDLVVLEPDGRSAVAPAMRAFRAEARLWHRPLLVVSSFAEVREQVRRTAVRGADETLPADVSGSELLAKVSFLLTPVEQVRERMVREKIASGEIGPVGVAMLVRLAVASRAEGRLVLRGDNRLVELDLRNGELAAALLSEPDGRQLEGGEALAAALTIRSGRYSLRPPPIARPAASLHLPLPQTLWAAADHLTNLLARTAAEQLPRVRRLRLRERAGAIRGMTSTELRVRERLQAGEAPRVVAGAPGLTSDAVARLVERLVLAGDVIDVEEGEVEVPPPPPEPSSRPVREVPTHPPPTPRGVREGMLAALSAPAAAARAEKRTLPDVIAVRERPVGGERGRSPATVPPRDEPTVEIIERGAPAVEVFGGGERAHGPVTVPPRDEPLVEVLEQSEPAVEVLDASAAVELPHAGEPPAPPPLAVAPAPAPEVPAAGPEVPAKVPEPVAGLESLLEDDFPEVEEVAVPLPEPAAAPVAAAEPPVAPLAVPPPEPPVAAPSEPGPVEAPPPPAPAAPVPTAAEPIPGSVARARAPAYLLVLTLLIAAGIAVLLYAYVTNQTSEQRSDRDALQVAVAPAPAAEEAGRVVVVAPPEDADSVTVAAAEAGAAPGAVDAVPPVDGAGSDLQRAPDARAQVETIVVEAAAADAASEVGGTDATAPALEAALLPEASMPDRAPDVRVRDAGREAGTAAVRDVAVLRDAAARPDRVAASADVEEPSGGPAVLIVPQPEGVDVAISVTVDGVGRGAAPLQLELAAGEHEVRFEAGGRRSLSIVRLRPGERKTVLPRQLIRELQQGGP